MPFLNRFSVLQIPAVIDEFHQVAVSRCRESAVLLEEVHLYPVSIGEGVPCPLVSRPILIVSRVKIAIHKLRHELHQINILISRLRDPREMIDAGCVRIDILSFDLDACQFFQNAAQEILGVKYFVAASESLDLRKTPVQRLHTDAHRIGEVQHPRVRTAFPDRLGKSLINRNSPQCTEDPTRSHSVTHGLQNTVFFRSMYIRVHLCKSTGQDGNDHEIGACERFFQRFGHCISEIRQRLFLLLYPCAYDLIPLCGGNVNIIERDFAGQIRCQGKIQHKGSRPRLRPAADVSNFYTSPAHTLLHNSFTKMISRAACRCKQGCRRQRKGCGRLRSWKHRKPGILQVPADLQLCPSVLQESWR